LQFRHVLEKIHPPVNVIAYFFSHLIEARKFYKNEIKDIAIILVISFFLKPIIESVLRPRRVVLHNEIKDRDNIDRVKMIIPIFIICVIFLGGGNNLLFPKNVSLPIQKLILMLLLGML